MFYAFEIKRKKKVNRKDCKSLFVFAKEYPQAKLYLLYGGNEQMYFDNVVVMPYIDALKNILEILA